jgi:hypothetical protein
LDVELKYNDKTLTFLVQDRNLYVRGWQGRGKVFEGLFGWRPQLASPQPSPPHNSELSVADATGCGECYNTVAGGGG